MRTRSLALFMCLCAVLLFAGTAFAQEQSGSIEGVVKDSSGGVLPGVTVEARNTLSSGVTNVVTDEQGRYRFPALAPGKYEITAKLQGFGDVKKTADLSVGQLLKIEMAMSVAGVSETVQVSGEAPLIDTKQSSTFTTVSRDIIDRIPKGRDFTSVVATAAGSNSEDRAGGLQVDGSSGSENRFIVDGMDTTSLRTGVSGRTVLMDFIQEVQVKSSGYNAEFGGSTGGVVSAITKSGSNNLRGSAGIYNQGDWGFGERRGYHRFYNQTDSVLGAVANFTPEGTNCATTGLMTNLGALHSNVGSATTPAGGVPNCVGTEDLLARDTRWRYLNPIGDLGGPIFKDRLWFYAGYGYTRNDRTRYATFQNDPDQKNRKFDWWDRSHYLNYNVTAQVNNNLRVRFSASNQWDKNRGGAPALQPDNDPIGFANNTNYPWITRGQSMAGYTTTTLPWMRNAANQNIVGQLDQTQFDNTYVKNGGDGWNNTYSGNVDWVVTPTLFVNATAGYFSYNNTTPDEVRYHDIKYTYSGTPCGYLDVPSSLCQSSGWNSTQLTSAGTAKNLYTRAFVNLNGTFFKTMAGQHTFKAGLRFERFGQDVDARLGNPLVTVYWNNDYAGRRGTYGYYMLQQNGTYGNVHSNNYSIWLQDTWALNSKFTINAGVRAENEFVPSYKQGMPDCSTDPNHTNAQGALDCQMSIQFGMRDKIAPRVGFAYDIKGDSKWKAYGSYSHYYDITKLELPAGSFGGNHWINYYWTLDTYDFSSIKCGEGSTGCPGTFISSLDWRRSSNQPDPDLARYFNRPGMTGIDPNLKPVKTGDMQFGLDHELNRTMSLGVRYIHKWVTRTIEDVGIYVDFLGDGNYAEPYLISNPGEGFAVNMEPKFPALTEPRPQRDYDAVEVRLRKRLSNNWAADASYTYSRIYGNFPGLASSDEWGRNSPNVNRLWDNTVMSYDLNHNLVYGVLNTDRPHVIKLSGSYDFKFGTSVGAFWIMESGTPNNTVFLASDGGYPVFPYGRNDMGRMPWYYNLDMVVTHEIKVGGNRRIQLQANFDNVLDLQRPTNYYYQQYGSVMTQYRSAIQLPIEYFFQGNLNPTQYGHTYPVSSYTVQQAATLYTTPKAAGGAYGGALWDNPFYGVVDQYSGRRSIRLNAKFTF